MVRLPGDVVRALRRRAATSDITIAEAARQLMLPKDVDHQLGLLEHAEWLRARLAKRRDDLVRVFSEGNADPAAVDKAIGALASLLKEWPIDDDGIDYTAVHGIVYP